MLDQNSVLRFNTGSQTLNTSFKFSSVEISEMRKSSKKDLIWGAAISLLDKWSSSQILATSYFSLLSPKNQPKMMYSLTKRRLHV